MSVRWRIVIGMLVLAATGAWAQAFQVQGFPHDLHRDLFPLCQGCHGGIESGNQDAIYPDASSCARCHDGTRVARVEWTGPTRAPSNLDFSHPVHATAVAESGESTGCAVCHRVPGAREPMEVTRAAPETCLGCHAHTAPDHLSESRDCAECHRTLAQADALPLDRISTFPSPASHAAENFLSSHAPATAQATRMCATCHAAESCTRCHLNGADLDPIRSLAADPRVAVLEAGRLPEYPTPPSHGSVEWDWRHGSDALGSAGRCANCHAQPACLTCHTTSIPSIEALPPAALEDPRGVQLSEGPRVHEVGFATSHDSRAGADPGTCATCHSDSFCTSCHAGPSTPAFHYGDYLQMHGPEAWGNESECSTCHDTDVFCRGCHEALGQGSVGRLDVAYHSRRPFWLFGHGTAARQGLESCRTCHSQTDCTVCHAAVGSWRVNPHGPGFPAERLREANIWSCLACHRTGVPR